MARVLGVPRNQVTVECLRMGGAFGGKEVQANALAAIAALGAWKTRRPVRVRLTRELDMAHHRQAPSLSGAVLRRASAATASSRPSRIELYSDGGWSLDLSEPIMWRSLFHCDNAYQLPAVDVTGRVCRTHKTSQTAFRGFGGPQAMLVIEEILAQAAQRLRLPADVVRERNFYREGDTTHYGQPVAGRRPHRDDLAAAEGDEPRSTSAAREVASFNAANRHQKRGLAITPVKFGISFTATFFNQAGALVLVYRDGTVQVNHGGTEMGQGLFTKIQQIAADSLGVSMAQVRVMSTRTDKVPNTSATAASAGTRSERRRRRRRLRADQVEARVRGGSDPRLRAVARGVRRWRRLRGGQVDRVRQPVRGGLQAARSAVRAGLLPDARHPLRSQHRRGASRSTTSPTAPRCRKSRSTASPAPTGCCAPTSCRTSATRSRRSSIAVRSKADFCRAWAGSRSKSCCGTTQGRVATAGASTYKLPSWSEVPDVFDVDFLERATQPDVVLGSKAVGEPPLMLAISVREAIREAVAAFGEAASVTFDSPATPERVFFAVRRVRSSRPAVK